VAVVVIACVVLVDAQPQRRRSLPDYGGSADNSHYFAGNQVTRSNVSQLEVAWTYPTRDPGYAFNPVIADGGMYVLARNNSLVALDAASGREFWVHEGLQGIARRGINYWQSPDGKERRLLFQINHTLQAIDANSGKTILDFGDNGFVDLRAGLRREHKDIYRIQSNNPGKVFQNLIILGSVTGEGYLSPPGDLRAFDVRTGHLVWQFHTVPHPGEYGCDTWPKEAWKYVGGVNVWGEITVDEQWGIAYFPLGSATYDFYGADRHGANLFANSLLALDARTGKRRWHQQLVHHDLWDYDLVAAPQLLTVRRNGRSIDAVAQSTKQGYLFVFDRVTGEPVFPIKEMPVPPSDVPGEQARPTQPVPALPPFARQTFTVADINPHLPENERARWTEIVKNSANRGLFTPPALRDTVQMPGNRGGSNWGTTSANPGNGRVYVMSIDAPAILKLDVSLPAGGPGGGGGRRGRGGDGAPSRGQSLYQQQCQSCHGANREGVGAVRSLVGIQRRSHAPEGALPRRAIPAHARRSRPRRPQHAAAVAVEPTRDAIQPGGALMARNRPRNPKHRPPAGGLCRRSHHEHVREDHQQRPHGARQARGRRTPLHRRRARWPEADRLQHLGARTALARTSRSRHASSPPMVSGAVSSCCGPLAIPLLRNACGNSSCRRIGRTSKKLGRRPRRSPNHARTSPLCGVRQRSPGETDKTAWAERCGRR
jgi:quinoprotein glucose dehydrogenase